MTIRLVTDNGGGASTPFVPQPGDPLFSEPEPVLVKVRRMESPANILLASGRAISPSGGGCFHPRAASTCCC